MGTPTRSQLRELVAERRLGSVDSASVEIQVALREPPSRGLRERLAAEAALLERHPIAGFVTPKAARIEGQEILLSFDPIHSGAVRLSDLLAATKNRAGGLDDGLSAALTATAAQLTHALHNTPGLRGLTRAHGACSAQALVLSPSGTVALIGTGLPLLDALVLPQDAAVEARHTSPECAAGEPMEATDDVFGLGVLYLTLLAGRAPWAGISPEAHLEQLAAGRLTNPGVSIPDPRPELVELLRRAMAPSAAARYESAIAFGQAISNELKASGRPRRGVEALRALFDAPLPHDVPRGVGVILGRVSAPPPVVIPDSTPTRPAPPAHQALVAASAAPNLGAWSSVLGESTPSNPVAPSGPVPTHAPSSTRASASDPADSPPPAPSLALRSSAAPATPGVSALPLPSAPRDADASGSAPPAPPLGDAGVLEALYEEEEPRGQPDASRARADGPASGEGGARGTLLVGAVLLALVGVAWFFQGDEPEASPPPPADPIVRNEPLPSAWTFDAGPSPRPSPATAAPRPEPKAKPVGYLTVFSTPTGATVNIDGGYVGRTPLVMKHEFENRSYEVQLERDGYKAWRKSMRPEAGKTSLSVKAILEKR